MIYVKLPTGDHGWGIVGDNLSAALARLTSIERLGDGMTPRLLPGPLLQNVSVQLGSTSQLRGVRNVAYAVFEEDVVARRYAPFAKGAFDVVATACHWCEDVLRDAGLGPVTTIPHGIDSERFNPARAIRQRFHDRFVVFSGGKFEFRKGQDVVVRAFKIFAKRHPDALLIAAWYNGWKRFALSMIASPHFPLRAAEYASFDDLLTTWLNDTGLDLQRVERVPQLPNVDLAAIYGDTDVGLFPNRCEGATNLVMMEYMACGRSVVATDFSGHRDVLTEGNSVRLRAWKPIEIARDGQQVGVWCEPDIDEIVEQLEWAYTHRDQLSARGRQAAADLDAWTWERAARRFATLLNGDTRTSGMTPNAFTSSVEDRLYHSTILKTAERLSRADVIASAGRPEALYLHGLIAKRAGHHATAIACLTRAVQQCPQDPTYLAALADLLDRPEGIRRPDLAQQATAGTFLHLGTTLARDGHFFEAADAYQQALDRKADCLPAWLRLGTIEMLFRDPEQAVRCFRAALALDPSHVAVHQALGWALHLVGDVSNGWDEFAWLNHPQIIRGRRFEQPLWDGADIEGRTILAWAGEHYGLGDTLHLARYITSLSDRGARVVAECQHGLVPLVATVPGVDKVIPHGAPLPAFDVHAPLMWIPTADRTLRWPVPAGVPYFSVDPHRIESWRIRLGAPTRWRVGLRWGGLATRKDASLRFVPVSTFARLGSLEHLEFISLQTGPQADELFGLPEGFSVREMLDNSCSIVDTAALIMNLDLVVTVDTMIAHLTGALARPVWDLLPAVYDWRWPAIDQTPWYPTMRTFRQPRLGNWSEVVENIHVALAEMFPGHVGPPDHPSL